MNNILYIYHIIWRPKRLRKNIFLFMTMLMTFT
jgi:hypothetical protein